MSGLGTEMPPDAKPSDTAPAPVPGKCYGAEDGAVGEPLPDDGRRTLDELETAGEVLVRAALLRVDLAEPLRKVLLTVRRLAYRMLDGDRSGSQRIDSLASKIHDASKAAGTGAADPMNLRRRSDVERRFVDQALARGACSDEIAAVERFSSDYDTLRRHGCEPRQSRERFIELNLRQWRLTRN
ncbi:MAG: hypothetical protein KAI24_00950 [Planctomycetes bacterium]|nr:hypothetical protein [Planctomycetota bacterium]